MPPKVCSTIGSGTVDVMPWNSSLAIANGLTLKQRPIMESYVAYAPWLDEQNARFLQSENAPDFVLYVASAPLDRRPGAWEASTAKRTLIQWCEPVAYFPMEEHIPDFPAEPQQVTVLRRSRRPWDYRPFQANEVTVRSGQPLHIPPSTNDEFLWLNVQSSFWGKIAALAGCPQELTATFTYSDGTTRNFRAIVAILATGVFVNYRVESAEEIQTLVGGAT